MSPRPRIPFPPVTRIRIRIAPSPPVALPALHGSSALRPSSGSGLGRDPGRTVRRPRLRETAPPESQHQDRPDPGPPPVPAGEEAAPETVHLHGFDKPGL